MLTGKLGFAGKTPKVDINPVPKPPTAEDELDKYSEIWKDPLYRINSPAMRDHFDGISAWAKEHGMSSIMDFGAGKGTLDLALRKAGYGVIMLDIAENCLDRDVREALDEFLTFEQVCLWHDDMQGLRADGVICIDVLEHLPQQHVGTVARYIRETAPHGYCNAALFPHKVNGRELHLTLKKPAWWFQHFPEAECTATDSHALMVW